MINYLRKKFIKDYQNINNQNVREAHGKLAAILGIMCNLFLFLTKLVVGLLSKSLSIVADSINNLSDMGSSVVTLVGFHMANKPADKKHPFGHERMEYIAGLVVAIIIIFVGGSLLFSSVDKIINYEYVEISTYIVWISIGILFLSILIKTWQTMFNKKIGKLIDSVALEATSCDSRNDVIATSVILIGTLLILFLKDVGFSIDGILGVLVSLFIIFSGIKTIKETMDPLIGSSISKEYIEDIISNIKSNEVVLGVHDILCHMYGPTKCFMTAHVEVDAKGDIIKIHDAIDEIEQTIKDKYGVMLTIHMDPVVLDDDNLNRLKEVIGVALKQLDENLTFHDFRIVRKSSKSTLIFDIVIPYDFKLKPNEITQYLDKIVNDGEAKYNILINYDHQYINEE